MLPMNSNLLWKWTRIWWATQIYSRNHKWSFIEEFIDNKKNVMIESIYIIRLFPFKFCNTKITNWNNCITKMKNWRKNSVNWMRLCHLKVFPVHFEESNNIFITLRTFDLYQNIELAFLFFKKKIYIFLLSYPIIIAIILSFSCIIIFWYFW